MKLLGLLLCVAALAVLSQAQSIPANRPQTFDISKTDYSLWWYGAMLQAIRINTTAFGGPVLPTRSYAILAVAIHDAVNAFNPVAEFYTTPPAGPPLGANIDAAITGAGYQSMLRLYPNRAPDWVIIFRAQLALLKRLRNGIRHRDIQAGFNFGRKVADGIYNLRVNDGAFNRQTAPYTNSGPGIWQPTAPGFEAPVGATWGQIQPWAIPAGNTFRPPLPPFQSPDFGAEYLEVFDKGVFPGAGLTTRTALETYSAIFFAVELPGQSTPPGLYMETAYLIAKDNNFNRADTARFVALTAIAQADAAVTAWDAKFFYGGFRPVNAIINNTNQSLPSNPNWRPLIEATPPFPDYVSGHSTFGGAVTRIWQNWFNTDTFRYRVRSDSLPGVNAVYNSFSQYATDNGFSRVFAGVHFRKSCADGINAGIAVADFVWQNVLRPL